LKEGKKVIVVAHECSIKAIIKQLDGLSENEVMGLTIPTALPLIYELDENLKPLKHYYIATEKELKNKELDKIITKLDI
jgi:2,3-bisphosphoglycerate-dependent phosphoglycerate mutase